MERGGGGHGRRRLFAGFGERPGGRPSGFPVYSVAPLRYVNNQI